MRRNPKGIEASASDVLRIDIPGLDSDPPENYVACEGVCSQWHSPDELSWVRHLTNGVLVCAHLVCAVCLKLHQNPGPHLHLRDCKLLMEKLAWREPQEPSPFGSEKSECVG